LCGHAVGGGGPAARETRRGAAPARPVFRVWRRLRMRIRARRQAKRRVALRGRAGAAPRRVSRGRRRAKERTMTPYRAALALFVLLLLPALAGAAPEGKIVIAQGVDPTTLDPQWHEETPAYNVLLNIYDTLLFRDNDPKLSPGIAVSWRLV